MLVQTGIMRNRPIMVSLVNFEGRGRGYLIRPTPYEVGESSAVGRFKSRLEIRIAVETSEAQPISSAIEGSDNKRARIPPT